jgi:hypothetical protein
MRCTASCCAVGGTGSAPGTAQPAPAIASAGTKALADARQAYACRPGDKLDVMRMAFLCFALVVEALR